MKILIHDINFLGDTLLSSPVYKAFKDAGHEVHSLGSPYQRELLEGNPYIDKIWTPKNQWGIIPQLRAECFDYTMQLNTSLKTNLFLKTLGSISIGYSYKWKGLPLDIKIPIDRPTCTQGNRIEEIDDLIFSAFGLRLEPRMIFECNAETGWENTIVINTESGRHFKERMWGEFGWTSVILWLSKRGYRIYVADSRKTRSIGALARIIKGCRLLITVNSFPMHLGISQGTPTLALIGRTPKEVIVHPSVKNFWYLEDPAIFDKSLKPMQFTVEEVLEKVKECLSHSR